MIKLFDQFDYSRFSEDDIIDIIKKKDYIYVKNIKNLPDHDEENPVRPVDIDEDGLITIEVDGRNYEVNLKNVTKLNESKSSIDISKDIIQDIYQDLLDTIEWEYEIEYKIYDETLIGICIFDKRLYYQDELRNSTDKFEVIFDQCKKGGWVSSSGMTGRMFPDKESKVVHDCSDRMVNHLGFIKPLIEVELFDNGVNHPNRWLSDSRYDNKSNLCGYQFFFTNKGKVDSKTNESSSTEEDYKELIKDYFLDFTDNFEYFKFDATSKTIGYKEYPKYEKYQVRITIEERYWNRNKQEISYSINSCINHLLDSTDLKKNGSDNWFDRIDGHVYRVIDKFFITR